jgi:hypothetical protein
MMMPENPENLLMSEEQVELMRRRARDIADERAARMKRVAAILPEFEECTEQILGSAESIARIYDEDTAIDELERFLHALQVVTFYMMRVEDDVKNPREIPVTPCTHEPGNRKAPAAEPGSGS